MNNLRLKVFKNYIRTNTRARVHVNTSIQKDKLATIQKMLLCNFNSLLKEKYQVGLILEPIKG